VNRKEHEQIAMRGETDAVEFKKSTAQLRRAMETLCAMLFLRRHLPVAGRIVPGLFEREDEPLFPLEALREALVNAFCHRDYTIAGGAVSLAIYDDRLEIWSDGTLPFGLTPEDLKRDHPSKPRNPLIAKVFYLRGVIERWGGTDRFQRAWPWCRVASARGERVMSAGISWNKPDNKLEGPAYSQPKSVLSRRNSGRRRSDSETAQCYSCAITPMPLGLRVPGSEFLVEGERWQA